MRSSWSSSAASFVARRNWKAGRVDQHGASRVAATMCILSMAVWALDAQHSLDLQSGFDRFMEFALAPALTSAVLVWLLYLALEPYVRRYMPEILVTWVRLISGQIRDPRVHRDVLIGLAFGIVGHAFNRFLFWLPALLGKPPPPPQPATRTCCSARRTRCPWFLTACALDSRT